LKGAPGISEVDYYEDDEPKVKDCAGICGSPWVVGECSDEEWKGMLAGVHIAGARSGEVDRTGIFIRAEVLMEKLGNI